MDTSSSAHGTAAAASSSSSRSSNRWMYELLLSFIGDDTHNTFIDHLSIALRNAGVNTFIDYQLKRGENIQSELGRKIERSRIAVVVFSKRYPEFRRCLRELPKIMRCQEDQEGIIVYPIFYDVDPSDVRKQSGGFAEAFWKHERDEDSDEVEQWRKDLKASSDLGGQNLKTSADGEEKIVCRLHMASTSSSMSTGQFCHLRLGRVGVRLGLLSFSQGFGDGRPCL